MLEKKAETTWLFQPIFILSKFLTNIFRQFWWRKDERKGTFIFENWKWNRLYQALIQKLNTWIFDIRKLNNRPWSMGIEFDLCPVINFEKKCVYLTFCTVLKCYNVDDMCYLSIGWVWKYVVSMLKYMSHNDSLSMSNLAKLLYFWIHRKLSKKYIE